MLDLEDLQQSVTLPLHAFFSSFNILNQNLWLLVSKTKYYSLDQNRGSSQFHQHFWAVSHLQFLRIKNVGFCAELSCVLSRCITEASLYTKEL